MKTTLELPDQLMTEVESLAALEQRKVNDIIAELIRAGINSRTLSPEQLEVQANARKWLIEWLEFGKETLHDLPPGPTANEILNEDRNRLERG